MKTTTQPHGVHYEFNNGYTLSVVNGWAAMADESRPYEFMAWGENTSSTEAIGYQTKEDIDKIITMFEENNQAEIDAFFEKYKASDHEEVYYDPYEDGDLGCDDYSDWEFESRERIPGLQKEIQETQVELDKQLQILGDTAIPIILINISRTGGSDWDEHMVYTTITCLNTQDGQIIDALTQKLSYDIRETDLCCNEEIIAIRELESLQLYLKLAKAGYKVILSHNL